MFVFATETCAACPLRAQCTRGRGGRTVQRPPAGSLAPASACVPERSPAFGEVRRRRQVVEHRIARLVQLGIRQARYIGRTRTLFQVGLAAAVANLTLLVQAGGKEPGPIREPGMMRHPYLTGTKDGYASSTESVAEQRGAE